MAWRRGEEKLDGGAVAMAGQTGETQTLAWGEKLA